MAKALKTLVLNTTGTPLSTWPPSLIPTEEAICAIVRDRVTVIENWPDAFYRSPSVTMPVPKTVMLREYAHISATPKFCRRSVLLRDRFRCQFCGQRFPSEELTFDHFIPRSKGGKTTWENILTACMRCNTKKRDKSVMRPLQMPRRPTTAELLRAGLEFLPNEIKESWADYLYWQVGLEP